MLRRLARMLPKQQLHRSFSTKSFELEQALQQQLRDLTGDTTTTTTTTTNTTTNTSAKKNDLALPDDDAYYDREQRQQRQQKARNERWNRPAIDEVREFITQGLVRRREPMLERAKIGTVAMPSDVERRLAQLIRGLPKARLAEEARLLSDALRSRTRRSLFAPPTSKKADAKRGVVVDSTTASTEVDEDEASSSSSSTTMKSKKRNNNDDDDDGGGEADAPKTDDVAPVIVYDRGKALAYAAHRFPGVLGCVTRVLTELRLRRPSFEPSRMFDYGCGPGTAILAANRVWPDALQHVTAIDTSIGMQSVAETLLGDELRARVVFNRYDSDGEPFGVRNDEHRSSTKKLKSNYPSSSSSSSSSSKASKLEPAYDLCTLSYMLSEMHGGKARRRLVRNIWQRVRPGGVIVVIEPGTPVGFSIVREVREVLLGIGTYATPDNNSLLSKSTSSTSSKIARTVAPCPHDGVCPLDITTTWCHFGQRVRRTRAQQSLKGGINNVEDEKFCYVIIEKLSNEPLLFDEDQDHDDELETKPSSSSIDDTEINEDEVNKSEMLSRRRIHDIAGRIIRPPVKGKGRVTVDVCTPEGVTRKAFVVPRDGWSYRSARKAGWGDRLRATIPSKFAGIDQSDSTLADTDVADVDSYDVNEEKYDELDDVDVDVDDEVDGKSSKRKLVRIDVDDASELNKRDDGEEEDEEDVDNDEVVNIEEEIRILQETHDQYVNQSDEEIALQRAAAAKFDVDDDASKSSATEDGASFDGDDAVLSTSTRTTSSSSSKRTSNVAVEPASTSTTTKRKSKRAQKSEAMIPALEGVGRREQLIDAIVERMLAEDRAREAKGEKSELLDEPTIDALDEAKDVVLFDENDADDVEEIELESNEDLDRALDSLMARQGTIGKGRSKRATSSTNKKTGGGALPRKARTPRSKSVGDELSNDE